MEKIRITKEEKTMFDYLNDLRESGVTNMYGAAPYLVENFDVDNQYAITVLSKWMDNFNEEGYEYLL